MVFSSIEFLVYFLPAFLLVYYTLPWRNLTLVLASLNLLRLARAGFSCP